MKKALSLTTLIVALTLALAGCGSNGADSSSGGSVSHNQQDVTFATDMIPHHLQAVQMAEMAQTQASLPAVRTLAEEIKAAQGPEIETMSGWLKGWGEDVPDESMGGMDGMDSGSSDSMPGMMSDQAMSDLGAATGDTFDQMWLESMIAHHEGAVQMSDTEIADGKDPDAVALAKSIKAAQTTEIATMKKLLAP
ncbi:DUF305 domain-containing protein [Nocardioides zhouii]|uniref:DUF305 domain-containing protein n=1 Tax=Nocardioides zhouii TaxID=1168729 RepID=A0A4Q2SGA8_9ACTN|nr:DUF305 domain-containing protein [Nocardioides zhouii]RYC03811.1 DUF305 domain-containing protein [Nocardioides zhouii]